MKFNPFHDRLGRFANKFGFSTYSANPKMRAAQPSIMRSARAGHGKTLNVHRESKGENINQNYDWMSGKPYGKGNATATTTTTQSKPKPTTQKPTRTTTQQQQNTSRQSTRTTTPQQQPTRTTTQQSNNRKNNVDNYSVVNGKAKYAVDGKDLSNKFSFDNNSTDYSIEQVIKAQGFDGQPTLTNDPIAFANACKSSNFVAVRGISATDSATMQKYDDELKYGDFYVKCSGGSVHGYGLYAASYEANSSHSSNLAQDAQSTARSYASGSSVKKIYSMTLDKSAKIGTESTLYKQMMNDKEYKTMCSNSSMNRSYTMDVGVYAAYKGYDAFIANNGRSNHSSDYTVILNRSKLIIFDAGAS